MLAPHHGVNTDRVAVIGAAQGEPFVQAQFQQSDAAQRHGRMDGDGRASVGGGDRLDPLARMDGQIVGVEHSPATLDPCRQRLGVRPPVEGVGPVGGDDFKGAG